MLTERLAESSAFVRNTHYGFIFGLLSGMPNDQPDITLRPTAVDDLEVFFRFQQDEEARFLAAFTPEDLNDPSAYQRKHTRLLSEPTVNNQTILVNKVIAGSIAKFEIAGEAEITYWIDKNFWGRKIATRALKAFLALEPARPLIGRAAFDNFGSQKVLERCGFVRVGTDRGYANARQAEIEEFIYQLT